MTLYNEIFDLNKHKDICPTCKSDYNTFSCERKDWKTSDCNCYLQNKLWKDYSLANIPNDYFSKDFNDYSFFETEKEKKYFKEIKKYINNLDKVYEYGASLFLYNKLSYVGKTFFAICILKEAYRKNYSIKFVQFAKIYSEVISNRDCEQFLKNLNKFDFLVIDSTDKIIKKEFLTDIKLLNYFENFLKNRFKPIIFTSSSQLDENIEILKIIKKSLRNRIYELYVDSSQQYYNPNNYWENILSEKLKIIK